MPFADTDYLLNQPATLPPADHQDHLEEEDRLLEGHRQDEPFLREGIQ